MKLKNRILILLLIFSIAPVLMISEIILKDFIEDKKMTYYKGLESISKTQAMQMDYFFQQLVSTNLVGKYSPVYYLLKNSYEYRENLEDLRNQVKRIIYDYSEVSKDIDDIIIIDKNNTIIESTIDKYIGKAYHEEEEKLNSKYGVYVSRVKNDPDIYNGEIYYTIKIPIYDESRLIGGIIFNVNLNYFYELIEYTNYFDTGHMYMITDNGTLISSFNFSKLVNINDKNFDKNFYLALKKEKVKNKTSGKIEYKMKENDEIGFYKEVPFSGWKVVNVVNKSEISSLVIKSCLKLILIVGALIIICILISIIVSGIIMKYINKVIGILDEVKSDIYKEDKIHKSKIKEFDLVLNSIDDMYKTIKVSTNKIMENEMKYKFIVDSIGYIIYEIDLNNDNITTDKNKWKDVFGEYPSSSWSKELYKLSKIVYPDDIKIFNDFFDNLQDNSLDNILNIECRLLKYDRYVWTEIRTILLNYNQDKNNYYTVLMKDINSEKQEKLRLIDETKIDGLTGLMNKNTFELNVDEYINREEQIQNSYLFIVDIDDFKSINDRFGHSIGDEALLHLSDVLKNIFNRGDILGRIGGVQFGAIQIIDEKEEVELFCRILVLKVADHFRKYRYDNITISIGVALIDDSIKSYKEIFDKADRAMYTSKVRGKNTYYIID